MTRTIQINGACMEERILLRAGVRCIPEKGGLDRQQLRGQHTTEKEAQARGRKAPVGDNFLIVWFREGR